MLVFKRREGQEIVMSDGVQIRVKAVQGNRVRLAIVALRGVAVVRREIEPVVAAIDARNAPAAPQPVEELV